MNWSMGLKRAIDVVGAGVGLVVLSPVMAAACVAVGVSMGRPILFRQTRPGRGGKPFEMVKFRTMRPPNEGQAAIGGDEGRITPVGRWLRATSIDELPTLWNVLWGQMSLVGPRPLLMRYLDRYDEVQFRRHNMRPGITGWAQIHGRNATDWDSRLERDVWYVEHWSLALDLEILWRTLRTVVARDGINQPGHVTMPEFRGDTHGVDKGGLRR